MAFKRKDYHKETNCLNCNYPLIGKFCGNCGQKAFLHKDSFLHMISHFVSDYFHYDNKFWLTVKTFMTKPGLVTLEFIEGKRVKYINPIQLYIFVTTVLVLIGFTSTSENSTSNKNQLLKSKITYKEDTTTVKTNTKTFTGINSDESGTRIGIGKWSANESTLIDYDSVQNSLPDDKKDGFLLNKVRRQSLKNNQNFNDLITQHFLKLFFILLPFFAFLLKVIFRKHKFFYVDHLIFSIHFHSLFFFITIIVTIIELFINNDANYLSILMFIGIILYLFLALKRVYPTHWFKLLIKGLILGILYFVGFFVAFILFAIGLFLFAN